MEQTTKGNTTTGYITILIKKNDQQLVDSSLKTEFSNSWLLKNTLF